MKHDVSPHGWLEIVITVGIVERLLLWSSYPVATTNDTPTYIHLARFILNKGFDGYAAYRTPGYPLFIAGLGLNSELVYAVQLILGFLTTMLFFYLGQSVTGKSWVGALAGLAHTLNPGQLFFEAYIMSEALTTFFLVGTLTIMLVLWNTTLSYATRLLLIFLAGLLSSAIMMIRPLFIYLPFLIGLFLLFGRKKESSDNDLKRKSGMIMALCIPAIITLGLWVNYVHANYKTWALDAIGGYHLVNNTGTFFEYVPDEYAAIRDTYIEYRTARLAGRGTQVNTIWDAVPELQKVSKLNYYALARLLNQISLDLIREHPDLYIRNLVLGWWWFWLVAVYWAQDAVSNPFLRSVLHNYILVARIILFGCNLVFLGSSLLGLASRKVRHFLRIGSFEWMLISIIWAASILQTFGEHGDNSRFLVPLQSVIVFVVLLMITRVIEWQKIKDKILLLNRAFPT